MSFISNKPVPWKGTCVKKMPKAETDVNLIVKRFMRTGMLPPVTKPPMYADLSEVGDCREMVEKSFALKKQMEVEERAQASKKADTAKSPARAVSTRPVGDAPVGPSGREERSAGESVDEHRDTVRQDRPAKREGSAGSDRQGDTRRD